MDDFLHSRRPSPRLGVGALHRRRVVVARVQAGRPIDRDGGAATLEVVFKRDWLLPARALEWLEDLSRFLRTGVRQRAVSGDACSEVGDSDCACARGRRVRGRRV